MVPLMKNEPAALEGVGRVGDGTGNGSSMVVAEDVGK